MQAALREISIIHTSIPQIAADGIFGSKTADAVYSFQKLFSDNPNGEVNNDTWNRIFSEYAIITLRYKNSRTCQLVSSEKQSTVN